MSISIRNVEDKDAPAVHEILTSQHVVEGTMRLKYMPPETTHTRIQPEPGKYKLVAEIENKVVGFAELITHPDLPRHAHVGEINMICVRADHQGKGVARALFQEMIDLAERWLGIHRLGLVVWENNKRAIKTYEKYGFEIEGTMRDYVLIDGKWVNAVVMGRLRPE
ncbi:MAG: GNAT family N-acetyltransferase [Pseudomonadota bacterium]